MKPARRRRNYSPTKTPRSFASWHSTQRETEGCPRIEPGEGEIDLPEEIAAILGEPRLDEIVRRAGRLLLDVHPVVPCFQRRKGTVCLRLPGEPLPFFQEPLAKPVDLLLVHDG